jgi:hypothetical protein
MALCAGTLRKRVASQAAHATGSSRRRTEPRVCWRARPGPFSGYSARRGL